MRAFLATALFVAVAFAGCADEGAGPTSSGPAGDDETAFVPLQMPTWSVGDYWTYQSPFGTNSLVVGDETASDWIVDTDSEETAFFHAREPISFVGAISKATLAGSQAGGPVRFFDWPLEDGKTWTATWDGTAFTMEASRVGQQTFQVAARNGDVVVNEFQYSNATKWFDWISFGDETGAEQFRMELVERGSSFGGQLVRVEPEVIDAVEGMGPLPSEAVYGVYEVEDADLYLDVAVACETGPGVFALGPAEAVPSIATGADSDGWSHTDPCPYEVQDSLVISENPNEGTWGYAAVGGPDFTFSFELTMRHFTRFSAGDAP